MNILITSSFVALLLTSIFKTRISAHSTHGTMSSKQLNADSSEDIQGFEADFPEKSKARTEFTTSGLTVVRAWSSTGAFYTLDCDAVELAFLGLDRFEPTPRSQDPAGEDAFILKMRQLGAKHYASVSDYFMRTLENAERSGRPKRRVVRAYGWPADGGVWALKMAYMEAWEKGVGRIHNAFTMEERCREIEKLGGGFYADPRDCPDLDLP